MNTKKHILLYLSWLLKININLIKFKLVKDNKLYGECEFAVYIKNIHIKNIKIVIWNNYINYFIYNKGREIYSYNNYEYMVSNYINKFFYEKTISKINNSNKDTIKIIFYDTTTNNTLYRIFIDDKKCYYINNVHVYIDKKHNKFKHIIIENNYIYHFKYWYNNKYIYIHNYKEHTEYKFIKYAVCKKLFEYNKSIYIII